MDKIKLEQMTLESLAGSLNSMSESLEGAASSLKKIDISRPAGGNLFARLSSIRFSMLDLTLADEAVEFVLKAIGVVASMAAGKTLDIRQRVQDVVSLMESTEAEALALIEDAVCDPEGWQRREAERAAEKAAARQKAIDAIVAQMNMVSPPEGHFAISAADKLANDGFYQFAEGFYSVVTGDWENIGQSEATRAEFLMTTMLQSCTTGEFEPFEVTDLVNDGKAIIGSIPGEQMEKLLEHFGVNEFPGDAVGPLVNMGVTVMNGFVDYVNQLRVLNSLDSQAALSMAESYINSDNPSMQDVGRFVKMLVEASPAERVMIVTGEASLETRGDLQRTAVYDVAMFALGKTAAGPIGAAISISGAVNDVTMNTGNNAELTNNMIYASEAARAIYQTFQTDLAAYKANPTDANLEKATTSYQNYYRTLSNSYDAYAAYVSNSEDSMAGQIFWDDAAKSADETAENSARLCRDRITHMDRLRSEVPAS